jgi:thioredoxin-dependent peroxiredoxin
MKLLILIGLLSVLALVLMRALRSEPFLQPGSLAPDFKLPDQSGTTRSLSDSSGHWRVVYFYPKDDTPGCTKEACHFRDDFAVLKAMGADVIGISVDSPSSHARFASKYQLPFFLLADQSGETARAYGALMDFGLFRIARRYTFLIDPAGHVAAIYRTVDANRHSKQVIDDLQNRLKTTNNLPHHGR